MKKYYDKKNHKLSFIMKYILFPISFFIAFLVITDPYKFATFFYSKVNQKNKNIVYAVQNNKKTNDEQPSEDEEFKTGMFPNYTEYQVIPKDNLSKINTEFNGIELKMKSVQKNDNIDIKIFFSLTCPACLKLVKESLSQNLKTYHKNITYVPIVNSLQDLFGITLLYNDKINMSIKNRLEILYTMANHYSKWIIAKDPKQNLIELIAKNHSINKKTLEEILNSEDEVFKNNAVNTTNFNFMSLTKPSESYATPMILIDNKKLIPSSVEMSKRIDEVHAYLMSN